MKKRNGMTKKLLTLLFGVAAILMLVSGCAGDDKDNVVITLNQREVAISVDETAELTATCELAGRKIDNKDIQWVSRKGTSALVDEKGVVTGIKGGTSYVTAVLERDGKEYSATCVVTVKDKDLEYSTYKLRWHVQDKDRGGYGVTEETFEREVGSKVELTLQEAKAKLPSGYVLNQEKSVLKGEVKDQLGVCIIDVYYDVAKVKYNVNYYYESATVLGTYDREVKTFEAYAFTAVNAPVEGKLGFVFNSAARNVLTTNSLTPGTNFSLFFNRARTNVTLKYTNGQTATYKNVYGVGLQGSPALTEDMGMFTSTGYVNGTEVILGNSYFKNLLADTTVQIGVKGNGFTYSAENGGTLIHTNDEAKTNSYAYTDKSGDTLYMKATYQTTGSITDGFGIALTDGKNDWQIRMNKYELIVNKNGKTDSVDWGSTTAQAIYNRVSVWKQGTYDMVWALWEGNLYCSINGTIVAGFPMSKIDSSWKEGKEYQIGVSALDTEGMNDPLKITNVDVAAGKPALAKLVTDKKLASKESAKINYEPITGTYVSSSTGQGGYVYAPETGVNIGLSTTIKWFNKDTATSAAGITVKVGEETRQIVVEGQNIRVRRHVNHGWDKNVTMTNNVIKYAVPFDADGKSDVVAAVKDGHLYVTYNGDQGVCIKMAALFPGYTKDTKATLGIFTWDANLGLSQFSDVRSLNETEVKALALTQNGYYSDSALTAADDTNFEAGSITKNSAGWKYVELAGASDKWQVSGTMKRYDAKNKGDCLMGFQIVSGNKKVLIVGHNYGLRNVPNGDWSDTFKYNQANTIYAFNNESYDFFVKKRKVDSLEFKAVIWEDMLYVWFNGKICWRVPLTEKDFGGFTAGSEYKLSLALADTDTKGGMENLQTKMSYEVSDQADLEPTLSIIDANLTRWDGSMRNVRLEGEYAENVTSVNLNDSGSTYIYFGEASKDIYLSATAHLYQTKATGFFGVTIKQGDQSRQVDFVKNGAQGGIALHAQHGWETNKGTGIPISATNTSPTYYNNTTTAGEYVWAQNVCTDSWGKGVNNIISTMCNDKTDASYNIDWAITGGVLYAMIEDTVVLRMPLSDLCATWTADLEYQIGLAHWDNNNNGDMNFKDIEVFFGDAAKEKLVTDKAVTFAQHKGMKYEVFTGSYLPKSAAGAYYAYFAESDKAQGISTTITLLDKTKTGSASGISIKANGQSAEIITEGLNAHTKIQLNHTFSNAYRITNLLPTDVKPFDDNGVSKVTAIVKNDTLYLFYNGKQAGAVEISKLLSEYKKGDKVQLGITVWDTNNGLSKFNDTKLLTEDEAKAFAVSNDVKWNLLFVSSNSNGTIDLVNGTIANQSNKTTRVKLAGSSTKWEVTGTMNVFDNPTTGDLVQGFTVFVGDKELRVLGHKQGLCIPWDFTHNTGNTAYAFNPKVVDFFGYNPGTGFVRTKTSVTFKVVIADDCMYVWIDGVPSWKVPLATKLYSADGKTELFAGFAAKSKYGFGFDMLDGYRLGNFANVNVKTGSAVNTACLSEFAGK